MALKKIKLKNDIDSVENLSSNVSDLEAENEYMIKVLEKIALNHRDSLIHFNCKESKINDILKANEKARLSNILSNYENLLKRDNKFLTEKLLGNLKVIVFLFMLIFLFNFTLPHEKTVKDEFLNSSWFIFNILTYSFSSFFVFDFFEKVYLKFLNFTGKRKKILVVVEKNEDAKKEKKFLKKLFSREFKELSLFKFGVSNLSESSSVAKSFIGMRYFRSAVDYSEGILSINLEKDEKGRYVLPSLDDVEKQLKSKLKKMLLIKGINDVYKKNTM